MRSKYPGQTWSNTLFDAGQPNAFGFARREERRANRHIAKDYCRKAAYSANLTFIDENEVFDAVDELPDPEPCRPTWREQSDYLSPLKRFLASHEGLPWATVYSKLCRRTNRSTTAGDHLMVHLDGYLQKDPWKIEQDKDKPRYYDEYYIDEDGIFRFLGNKIAKTDWRGEEYWQRIRRDKAKAEKLMAESPANNTYEKVNMGWNEVTKRVIYTNTVVQCANKIILQGNQLYWAEISRARRRLHFDIGKHYRPIKALSKKQAAIFHSLHANVRNDIVYKG